MFVVSHIFAFLAFVASQPSPGLVNLFESVPKLLVIFREISSCAHRDFEQQNGALDSLITIIIIKLYVIIHHYCYCTNHYT
jgi:hypothetical protein